MIFPLVKATFSQALLGKDVTKVLARDAHCSVHHPTTVQLWRLFQQQPPSKSDAQLSTYVQFIDSETSAHNQYSLENPPLKTYHLLSRGRHNKIVLLVESFLHKPHFFSYHMISKCITLLYNLISRCSSHASAQKQLRILGLKKDRLTFSCLEKIFYCEIQSWAWRRCPTFMSRKKQFYNVKMLGVNLLSLLFLRSISSIQKAKVGAIKSRKIGFHCVCLNVWLCVT